MFFYCINRIFTHLQITVRDICVEYMGIYPSSIWEYTRRVYGNIPVEYMGIYLSSIWEYTRREYGNIPVENIIDNDMGI
jgi:hypothetical protein